MPILVFFYLPFVLFDSVLAAMEANEGLWNVQTPPRKAEPTIILLQ
jgi:hypothetical protein